MCHGKMRDLTPSTKIEATSLSTTPRSKSVVVDAVLGGLKRLGKGVELTTTWRQKSGVSGGFGITRHLNLQLTCRCFYTIDIIRVKYTFRRWLPVIVPPDKYDLWLDTDVNDFEAVCDILKPYDANLMRRYPVSLKLNNSRIDDAESASPVTLDTPSQGQLF